MANTQINFNKILIIFLTTLAIAYVFWSDDLIPDAFTGFGPQQIVQWIDDAAVVVTMIFVFRKFKLRATRDEKFDLKLALVYLPIGAAVLWYIFWGVDLIPDGTFWGGWFDDAAAIFTGMWLAGKIRKRLWPKRAVA